jgi:hypothetical protein
MYSNFLFIVIPALLLIVAALAYFAWEKLDEGKKQSGSVAEKPEGAFRSFYHALWLLLLWGGLALSLPLWISYKQKILISLGPDRWLVMGKVLVFPLIMLVLLWYGGRQGYLKWIDDLDWPDKENK